MKAFAKLSLLLALVVAGRYLRLSNQATFQTPEKTTARVVLPDSLHFVNYTVVQASTAAPSSRPINSASTTDTPSPIWYY